MDLGVSDAMIGRDCVCGTRWIRKQLPCLLLLRMVLRQQHCKHSWESVQFSHSVLSDSLQPHESQHARPPCPSPTPGACSNSCPLSQWCHGKPTTFLKSWSWTRCHSHMLQHHTLWIWQNGTIHNISWILHVWDIGLCVQDKGMTKLSSKKQTCRSMEQNRKPRNRVTHLSSINLWQRRQEYTMDKKTVSLISGAGKN